MSGAWRGRSLNQRQRLRSLGQAKSLCLTQLTVPMTGASRVHTLRFSSP